ncbi:MAG: SWIM zinc finger family protein, partial [Lewinella sp.]|nr:SWIM zinc finger family protein [Lewinella sp.]
MLWNYSDLARLAPDPATLQRARGVSFALKNWLELSGNEKVIWGQYEGGGHQRYRVAVDMEQGRFFCTCRSPRHPCKHALAMPMILVRNNESFRVDYELPDWVRKAWTTSSQPKKKPKISEGPSDERLLRMQAGLSELEAWLIQIIENGLATIDPQDHTFWEELATRMTDNQLSGPAARLRSLIQDGTGENWYDRLLSTLSELYLLIRAFKRYYQLSPNLQQELLNVAGVTIRRDR